MQTRPRTLGIPWSGLCALAALLALAGCQSGLEHEPAVGSAWVAPATLQARKELSLRSPVSATLHHGQRVELIARRRRFIKLRTASGEEGWTDSRLLFSDQARQEFEQMQTRAQHEPSLGQATSLDPVTAHTAPCRQAPALFQVPAKQSVEVIARQRLERLPWNPPPLLEESAFHPKVVRKKKEPKRVPPPPPGPPPPVPDDWLLLSGYAEDKLPDEKPPAPPPAPPVMDDWTLVRGADGRAGWVLDRLLYPAIPDEVAQYAERARIVAYFDIGTVRDKTESKTVWLWAAQSSAGRAWAFDSLRIFTWSTRRHRYETSWIERGLRGLAPLRLERSSGAVAGFTVVVVEKDQSTAARRYALRDFRARLAARTLAAQPPAWYTPPQRGPAPADAPPDAEPPPALSLWQKLKNALSRPRPDAAR